MKPAAQAIFKSGPHLWEASLLAYIFPQTKLQSLHCFRFKLGDGSLEYLPKKALRQEKTYKQLELILNRTTSGKHLALQKRMGMLILLRLPIPFRTGEESCI